MDLRQSEEGHMGKFGTKKVKRKIMYLYFNFQKTRRK